MWLDWLVFCDYGFSVSALWCHLATLTVLLGFLLPWTWGISSQLLQQSAASAPYLGRGVSPHRCPSWPWTWSSSSKPSYVRTATHPGKDLEVNLSPRGALILNWKEHHCHDHHSINLTLPTTISVFLDNVWTLCLHHCGYWEGNNVKKNNLGNAQVWNWNLWAKLRKSAFC